MKYPTIFSDVPFQVWINPDALSIVNRMFGSRPAPTPFRPAQRPTATFEATAEECGQCHGTGFISGEDGEPNYCDREDCTYWAPREDSTETS